MTRGRVSLYPQGGSDVASTVTKESQWLQTVDSSLAIDKQCCFVYYVILSLETIVLEIGSCAFSTVLSLYNLDLLYEIWLMFGRYT